MASRETAFPGGSGFAAYDSHASFYAQAYAPYITDLRPAGTMGATLLEARQTAGDWSDAPTPDLILTQLQNRSVECTMDLGNGRFHGPIRQAEFAITPPCTDTTILIDGANTIRCLAVPYLSLLALAGERSAILPPDGDFGVVHARFVTDPALAGLLDRIWAEADHASPRGALFFEGAVLQMLARLLSLREGRLPRPARGGLAPWQVRRVAEHLRAHLDGDPSLAELAALVGLSPAYLCRAFAQSTGEPPHRFLLRLRVERAQALMADPRLGLAEIALRVGYASQSAFGTAFRRVAGVSPGEWRRAQ